MTNQSYLQLVLQKKYETKNCLNPSICEYELKSVIKIENYGNLYYAIIIIAYWIPIKFKNKNILKSNFSIYNWGKVLRLKLC